MKFCSDCKHRRRDLCKRPQERDRISGLAEHWTINKERQAQGDIFCEPWGRFYEHVSEEEKTMPPVINEGKVCADCLHSRPDLFYRIFPWWKNSSLELARCAVSQRFDPLTGAREIRPCSFERQEWDAPETSRCYQTGVFCGPKARHFKAKGGE